MLTSTGKSLALFWPSDLPAPTVSGPQATFEVSRNADLEVTARDAGFQANVVLAERPSGVPVYRFPIETTGVAEIIEGEGGGYAAVDGSGRALISIAPPVIFDSSPVTDPDEEDSGPTLAPLDSALVTDEAGRTVLELRPTKEYLDRATYPVTVDPSVDVNLTGVRDTYVREGSPTTSYGQASTLKVGYQSSTSALRQRAYLLFQTPFLFDTSIISASLKLRQVNASSCTGSSMWIRPVFGFWDGSATWNSGQPGLHDDAEFLVQTPGFNNGTGTCPNATVSLDVTPIVAAWLGIGTGIPNEGMTLRGANSETGSNSFKEFCSLNVEAGTSCDSASRRPTLTVTYNSLPKAPIDMAAEPGANCIDGVNRPFVNTRTPVLTGSSFDGDNDKTRLRLEVWPLSGSPAVATGHSGAFLPTKSSNRWMVPANVLADGSSYRWRAKGDDGTDLSSSWSLWCEFTVDVKPPNAAGIASSSYPQGAWAQSAGSAGTFTLTPGTDPAGTGGAASGIKAVLWSLDDPTPSTTVATTGGAVNVVATPTTDGPHTLYVATVDKAGNISAPVSYSFNVGSGAVTSPGDGDRSERRFTLSAAVKDATAVTFEYRRGETDTWTAVPDGSAITVTGGTSAPIIWDALSTLGLDAKVDLRVLLIGGTASGTGSTPISVTLDTLASDAATEQVGPGTLNLLTGDYTISATDTSYFGISVARTARSRDPQSGNHVPGQVGPFGPEWAAGGVAELAAVDWVSLTQTGPEAVQITRTDSTRVQFTKTDTGSGVNTVWEAEVGSEEMTLSGDSTAFLLTTTEGTRIEFTPDAASAGLFTVASATPPGVDNSTGYTYAVVPAGQLGAGQVRLARIIAPTAAVAQTACDGTGTPAVGCRVLEMSYASTTTASAGTPGDFAGRASKVKLWATMPGTSTVTSIDVARYSYDTDGRLVAAWDPRITPNLVTAYEYDSAGRVIKVIPPGEEDWRIGYTTVSGDSNAGRLASITRDALDDGKSETAWSVVYDVPLTASSGGPHAMDTAAIAAWGQTQAPTDATAVYPPDEVPGDHDGSQSSYTRATIHYLDVEGREVNTAIPGGAISTTEYDEFGNSIRELSFNNRARALRPATDSELVALGLAARPTAERAELLSSASIYDGDGQRLLQTFGPVRQVVLPGGAEGEGTALAREHVINTYDQGRPTDGSAVVADMVTTTAAGARLLGTETDVDVRTVRTFYDWTIGQPTKVISDQGGLEITTQTAYDNRARPIRTDMPSAVAASRTTGADSTITDYYTGTGSAPCGGKPEWDGMVCRTRPAGAITGGGSNPTQRITTTMTYDVLGQAATVVDVANSVTRTTTTAYDGAGRVDVVTTTGGLGAAVPTMKTVYAGATGRVIETRDTSLTPNTVITRDYDVLGRETAYVDADGGRTETTYTFLDQVKTRRQFSAGASPLVSTYTYSTDRQLLTQMVDPVAGTFTATYDPAGQVISHAMPAGVTMTQAEDPTGSWLTRSYAKVNGDVLLAETTVENIHGQTRTRVRGDADVRGSSQTYTYDKIGRLKQTDDTTGDVCISRVYGFDVNTNRTALTTRTGAVGAACPSSGGTPATSAYDTADRITNSGYVYDAHGRTTTAPLPTGTANLAYFSTDMVQRQTIGSNRQTWTLDPAMRLQGWTTENNSSGPWVTSGAKTNHYANDADSPAWILEGASGPITRNIAGITGDLAATTSATAAIKLLLTTLHGDTGQALSLTNPTTLDDTTTALLFDADEFGKPKTGTESGRYAWLGAKQRSTETISNSLVLMGVRLYNSTSGRFLSVDPIAGGSANAYDYAEQDPINQFDLDGRCVRGLGWACKTVNKVWNHGSVGANYCWVVCGGVSFQGGNFGLSFGGLGFGGWGRVGSYNSAKFSQQRIWSYSACASLGLGGCLTWGLRDRSRRSWWGSSLNGGIGAQVGINVNFLSAGRDGFRVFGRRIF
ncbi:MAG: DNRLRE domain-containing protein [Sporichthyaceae bacterium]